MPPSSLNPSVWRAGALALLLVMSALPLGAKDWDMDRGKYLPDLDIYLMSGPVHTVMVE